MVETRPTQPKSRGLPAGKSQQQTCCGVIEETKLNAREKRAAANAGPQPWIALKLMVGITFAMLIYAGYVYIGRFCVAMIRRDSNALGSRSLGIVFLVIFSILYLMALWTYEKVVVTPPGFARDHVPKSEQPLVPPRHHFDSFDSSSGENGGYSAEIGGPPYGSSPSRSPPHPTVDLSRPQSRVDRGFKDSLVSKASQRNSRPSFSQQHGSQRSHTSVPSRPNNHTRQSSEQLSVADAAVSDQNAGDLDTLPIPRRSHLGTADSARSNVSSPPSAFTHHQRRTFEEAVPSTVSSHEPTRTIIPPRDDDLPPPALSRYPNPTPILLPEYRYCSRDGLIKPYRAHHCRSCGTCVLKYDHHCPWLGQCVGARNQKFFVHFLQWAFLCCAWIFGTVVGLNFAPKNSVHGQFSDPQHIVIVALSGLFLIFTTVMLGSQIRLISLNQTTVEQMGMQSMKDRESLVLSRIHSFWQIG
ncbi:hypothetical protein HGRIS_006907 [Hohenbuehelia grisea]|uniref:Palmitoyltransferase n=1 Tax=Hohenbuehelia grisea TaxID=104357 RepID=A0ABR3JAJ1_9AGAR